MRNMLRVVFGACAIACGSVAAQSEGTPCGKNHFILEEPVPCVATDAAIGQPRAVAADGEGNVYFSTENQVFKVDASGRLSVLAGDGIPGFSGDGGPARQARLDFRWKYPDTLPDMADYAPYVDPWDWVSLKGGLAVDSGGNVYVADAYNRRVRRIDRSGIITTVAGPFGWLNGVALDREGNLFVGEYEGPLRKFGPAGDLLMQVPRCLRKSREPYDFECYDGIAADGLEGVYVSQSCYLYRVGTDGWARIVAGYSRQRDDSCGYSGDGGPVASAKILALGVAVDEGGSLYFTGYGCIRRVDPSGVVTTFAGNCAGGGFAGDGGPASEALFDFPTAIAIAPGGTVYVADTWNRRVRAITPDGNITTIAGNGK